ncbi:MAG: helical backbone metal receptor [Thermodesulfobacteriota bacterium]
MSNSLFADSRDLLPRSGFRPACRLVVVFLAALVLQAGICVPAWADSQSETPRRVVSLVPAATEMLLAMGAGESLVGVTSHDVLPVELGSRQVVGGFAAPSLKRIEALQPELILVSSLHGTVKKRFRDQCRVVEIAPVHSVEEALARMIGLGEVLGRAREAEAVAARLREELALIRAKVAAIPEARRPRVMRLMGSEPFRGPGDDSFQNDFIRMAGGTPPEFGQQGESIILSPEQIVRFDPEVIYVCGDGAVGEVLANPALRAVAAVKNRRVLSFPCELTCRAGVNMGGFVSWLAARLHEEHFSNPSRQVYGDRLLGNRPLSLPLGYVRQAEVRESRIRDFVNKTLVVDFARPQRVLSTLEGMRDRVLAVGNHFYPPPAWGLGHASGLDGLRQTVTGVLGRPAATTSLLFTGADMDYLAVVEKKYRDLSVHALVTAGVKSNAMRMARDAGNFYEPGTINILILPNVRLSERAMARAIITATEAKSAALQDLDIRSTYSPQYPATGTGTDNVLVAQGEGKAIDGSGGHTKMGELIASAVYDGVRQAVAGQNRLAASRSVHARLAERGVNLFSLLPEQVEGCGLGNKEVVAAVEQAILAPEYAGFVAGSLAMADAVQAGLADPGGHPIWARAVAARLAGREVTPWRQGYLVGGALPPLLASTLEALVNGVCAREEGRPE